MVMWMGTNSTDGLVADLNRHSNPMATLKPEQTMWVTKYISNAGTALQQKKKKNSFLFLSCTDRSHNYYHPYEYVSPCNLVLQKVSKVRQKCHKLALPPLKCSIPSHPHLPTDSFFLWHWKPRTKNSRIYVSLKLLNIWKIPTLQAYKWFSKISGVTAVTSRNTPLLTDKHLTSSGVYFYGCFQKYKASCALSFRSFTWQHTVNNFSHSCNLSI